MHQAKMRRVRKAYEPKGYRFPRFDLIETVQADFRSCRKSKTLAWEFTPQTNQPTFIEMARRSFPPQAVHGFTCPHRPIPFPSDI